MEVFMRAFLLLLRGIWWKGSNAAKDNGNPGYAV